MFPVLARGNYHVASQCLRRVAEGVKATRRESQAYLTMYG